MSEQQRERETVSRDKESIGQAQAAVGCVAALCCVCVGLPRVWGARDHPPPLSSLLSPPQVWNKDRSWTERADTGVLHNMCGHQPRPDNNRALFWKYSECITEWPLRSDLDMSWVGSLVSSPSLWTIQTPRSEEIQSSPQSGHSVWWRHCVNKPCSVSGKTKAYLWSPGRVCFVYTFQPGGAGEQHHG